MNTDLLYQLALTQVPQVGSVHAKVLVEHFGSASNIFKAGHSILERIEGIGTIRARNIKTFKDFGNAEKEIRFIEKYNITPLFINDKKYPQRLLNCYDSPTLLFYKGKADLNASRIIAIIGTRSNTEYGKQVTENLIRELAGSDVTIVSGLAFGIDAVAHRSSLRNNVPTIGVVAHGLDSMYPYEHASLARDMLKNGGGLLTEHRSITKPDKHNFPVRNRIVAGMCDASIVVETGIKGGSMITAELANGYNRDVFAFPGKTTDHKSSGCNHLIKNNKAILLTDAQQLIEVMSWENKKQETRNKKQQRQLFIELSPNEKKIFDMLNEKESMHIDDINFTSGLNSSAIAAALLELEMKSVVSVMPGKMYRLS